MSFESMLHVLHGDKVMVIFIVIVIVNISSELHMAYVLRFRNMLMSCNQLRDFRAIKPSVFHGIISADLIKPKITGIPNTLYHSCSSRMPVLLVDISLNPWMNLSVVNDTFNPIVNILSCINRPTFEWEIGKSRAPCDNRFNLVAIMEAASDLTVVSSALYYRSTNGLCLSIMYWYENLICSTLLE